MPGFTSIIGQNLTIRILQSFLEKEAVPHAMLFAGPAGVGKRTTARLFAMALNCLHAEAEEEKPCARCRSCRQMSGGQHPDLLLIEPKGAVLRIHQIRELLAVLAMKPFQARHRVVIIAQADAMNPEAGNALLKVLEEPPADTILILTTAQSSDLLPTIVSRCRHLRFNPLSVQDITALLGAQRNVSGPEAETVAHMSSGSLSKALQLIDTSWQDQRRWLIQAAGLDQPPVSDTNRTTAALSLAAILAGQKEMIHDSLDLLKTWIRDLAVVDQIPDQVVNQDCLAQLQRISRAIHPNKLNNLWQIVEKAQKAIAANANVRLTLDNMALGMRSLSSVSPLRP